MLISPVKNPVNMFSKVLVVVVAVCALQAYGGPVQIQPPEIQQLLAEIDSKISSFALEFKHIETDLKQNTDVAKTFVKTTMKQLKGVVKAAKGTVCGGEAALRHSAVKETNLDLCLNSNTKMNIKALYHNGEAYLKHLREEALLAGFYCQMTEPSYLLIAQCIDERTALLTAKLEEILGNTQALSADYVQKTSSCLQSVMDDLHLVSTEIQTDLQECLSPSQAPTTDRASSVEETSSALEDTAGEEDTSVEDTDAGHLAQGSEGDHKGDEGNNVSSAAGASVEDKQAEDRSDEETHEDNKSQATDASSEDTAAEEGQEENNSQATDASAEDTAAEEGQEENNSQAADKSAEDTEAEEGHEEDNSQATDKSAEDTAAEQGHEENESQATDVSSEATGAEEGHEEDSSPVEDSKLVENNEENNQMSEETPASAPEKESNEEGNALLKDSDEITIEF